jgi:hypothetical protein
VATQGAGGRKDYYEFESDGLTKHTKDWIVHVRSAKKSDPKGLSADGIKWLEDFFDAVKKSHEANKIFIKTSCWLAERKAKITSATHA